MDLFSTFHQQFGPDAGPASFLAKAPGRVNLIGEHTDYNDGFVMPAAIGFFTTVVFSPRSDRRIVVYSDNVGERREMSLDHPPALPSRQWTDYVFGVARSLEMERLRLGGANLLIHGEVPIGSGLSSSASIEVSVALALLTNSGLRMDPVKLALACQRAENEFAGMRCGIMDQYVSCSGKAGHALLLDCRSLESRALPLPAGVSVVICNTMVKHELASGEYNLRRADCETAAKELGGSLRDVTLERLGENRNRLPERVFRRARHVISEIARTLDAAAALDRGDIAAFGRLMAGSHASLRDDYEVSCPELDLMVDLANRQQGVYGARMTGGGFGGCTVNLVAESHTAAFRDAVADGYRAATGLDPKIYVCTAVDGAHLTPAEDQNA